LRTRTTLKRTGSIALQQNVRQMTYFVNHESLPTHPKDHNPSNRNNPT
jgi:hypothetical protein